MRSCLEMRRDAWGIMKGKWFWRLLVVVALLQLLSSFAGALLTSAYDALSITTVADYVVAKIQHARQGLTYSLPTAKAYCWMAGGFVLQMFIGYIFAAILSFGFMGLLLKARANDDTRWFADAFGGFARPLDVACLLLLMNLRVLVAAIPGLLLGGAGAALLFVCFGVPGSTAAQTAAGVAVALIGVAFSLWAVYAYRQAWFLKNENPDFPASSCLNESMRMMKGRKMLAFALDLSYLGWFMLGMVFYTVSAVFGVLASRFGAVAAIFSFCFGVASFYVLAKTIMGSFVARAVFYRDLQNEKAGGPAESEV